MTTCRRALLLLLDAKDKSDLLKTNLAALTKKWTAAGRALRTETFHGLAFTVVPLTSNDFAGILPKRPPCPKSARNPSRTKPGEIYFTQYQSLLVAGNSAKVVEAVAAHLTGGSAPAIADDAGFAADKLSQFRDSPTYYGWFNGSQVLRDAHDRRRSTARIPTIPRPCPVSPRRKSSGATGLGGLKSASFALREQPRRFLRRLAHHRAGSQPQRAAENSRPRQQGRRHPRVCARRRREIFPRPARRPENLGGTAKDGRRISPQWLASLNSVIDVANTHGAGEKSRLRPPHRISSAIWATTSSSTRSRPWATLSPTLPIRPRLYLLAVANPDQAVDAIKTIAGMSAPQDSANGTRDFLGHKIYTIALRATPRARRRPQPSQFALPHRPPAVIWPSAKTPAFWKNTSAAPTARPSRCATSPASPTPPATWRHGRRIVQLRKPARNHALGLQAAEKFRRRRRRSADVPAGLPRLGGFLPAAGFRSGGQILLSFRLWRQCQCRRPDAESLHAAPAAVELTGRQSNHESLSREAGQRFFYSAEHRVASA